MKQLSGWARTYIAATILASVYLVWRAVPEWHTQESFRFLLYFAGAFLASGFRARLPGINSAMSVNYIFVLVATMDLDLPHTMAVGTAGIVGQFVLRRKSWRPAQLAFNISSILVASSSCFATYHSSLVRSVNSSVPVLLFAGAATLFLVNTGSVSGIVALTERKNIWTVWREGFFWTVSHHLVGAAVAAVFHFETIYLGWESVVLTVPVIYFVYRSYAQHLDRLEGAKKHAKDMGDLHWRAIEALALAIDAKDETTHNHLLRVKVYATELGMELKMGELDMQALQAAALLHDIGKLAVPEYIISKPGKLTPEEFERMKVHPVVGAEILEQVGFPYPVVPIVRSHHEKWNGKGYPDGLSGEQIPLGARILAAVDCLDALASERQYRRALPLDEAMGIVASQSGTSFDPRVVEILARRYVELEKLAKSVPQPEEKKLSKNVKFENGDAPAAGFEEVKAVVASRPAAAAMISAAAVRSAFQSLLKLIEGAGDALSLDETLSVVAARLKGFLPYDTAVIYLKENRRLAARYAQGEDLRLFSSQEIPLGEGLSGWVAENRKSILNGNPAVETNYAREAGQSSRLLAAVSVPLESHDQVIGVLSLYNTAPNSFTREQLELLESIAPTIAGGIASAIQREAAAETERTGIGNARFFFANLAAELARAQRENLTFGLALVSIPGERLTTVGGEKLRQCCREKDYVAKLAGDDFGLILSDLQPDHAGKKVGQLKSALAPLRLSAGIAFYPRDGKTIDELFTEATRRMSSDGPEPRIAPVPQEPARDYALAASTLVH
jgi:putative nucleotidyltransferase with HDIG domain